VHLDTAVLGLPETLGLGMPTNLQLCGNLMQTDRAMQDGETDETWWSGVELQEDET
jgi:hypothetical protein